MYKVIKESICRFKQNQTKSRDARFELLRVIAMLLIVTCHVSMYLDQCLGVHTPRGLLTDATPISAMYHTVADAGQIGVAIFFIITGYFCCKSTFKFSRIINIAAHTWLYSAVITLIYLSLYCFKLAPTTASEVIGSSDGINTILTTILPISHNAYWFITSYIMLLICTPIINNAIKRFSHTQLTICISTLLIISLLGTLLAIDPIARILPNSIVMYIMGAWIRLYGDKIKLSNAKIIGLILLGIILMILVNYIAALPNPPIVFKDILHSWLYTNGVQQIQWLIGAAFFVLFMRAKPMVRNNITAKFIRIAGASTFSVYLLHEHKFLLLSIYNNINHIINPVVETWHGSFKLLVLIGVGVALFSACTVVAIICDHLFVNQVVKKLLSLKFIKQLCDKTDNVVNA